MTTDDGLDNPADEAGMDEVPAQVIPSDLVLTVYFLGITRMVNITIMHRSSKREMVAMLQFMQTQLKGQDLANLVGEASLKGIGRWLGKKMKQKMPGAETLTVAWRPEQFSLSLAEFRASDA